MSKYTIILRSIPISRICSDPTSDIGFHAFSFPYSSIYFNSPAGYGSFGYLDGDSSMVYESAFEDTWILVPPSTSSVNSVTVSLQCEEKEECVSNHYLENGQCKSCPTNMISNVGSTSIYDCKMCPPGSKLSHPESSHCILTEDYSEITQSTGWRIWAPYFHSTSGWSWAVQRLTFYADLYCQTPLVESGSPIDSDNAGEGYGPENAFGLGMYANWGGRVDDNKAFWLGMTFANATRVKCVELESKLNHVTEIRIQALDSAGRWKNVWVENLDVSNYRATNTIKLYYENGLMGTAPPTISPTHLPSSPPTPAPTSISTPVPTSAPSSAPESISLPPPTSLPTPSVMSDSTTMPTLMITELPVTKSPTVSPTFQPTSEPTKAPINNNDTECQETPQTKYLFKVKSNGQVVGRTCLSLSKKNSNRIRTICTREVRTNSKKFAPANEACPKTCRSCSSSDHSSSETSDCTQNGNSIFLLRTKTAKTGTLAAVRRSCNWLESKSQLDKSLICQSTEVFGTLRPAKDVCYFSCDSC